jgi:hypothetical protein
MMRTWLAVAVVALAGCDLYFGGDGDDDVTVCNGGYATDVPAYHAYDPSSGTCIYQGGWEGCDSGCGPCPEQGGVDWQYLAPCESACSGLSEDACIATPDCYATYDDSYAGDDANAAFSGCWQTVPQPAPGSCDGLDPYSCSTRDDCAIVYEVTADLGKKFSACVDEHASPQYCLDDSACGSGAHCDTSTCYSNCPDGQACPSVCYGVCVSDTPTCAAVDCGPGYHCENECYGDPNDPTAPTMDSCSATCIPDSNQCDVIDCGPGYDCVQTCDVAENDMQWCTSQCIPSNTDPGSCIGAVTCDQAPPPCPLGTTAGVTNGCYTGYCIPDADCGPNDPGECYGDVTCDQAAPQCPAGTTAGIANGCYTGYCIPDGDCASAPCETLSTEGACTARMDCSAVYTGSNCTCDANGCTCQSLSFARCESWWL